MPATAIPYAAAKLLEVRRAGPADSADQHEHIHGRHIDLSDMRSRGVSNVHARQIAQLNRLMSQGEGAAQHRLRGDDGGDCSRRIMTNGRRNHPGASQSRMDSSPPPAVGSVRRPVPSIDNSWEFGLLLRAHDLISSTQRTD